MANSKAENLYRPIFDALRAQNWRVEVTGTNHHRAVPPDLTKRIVFFAVSPARRSLDNALAALRRSGFVWPA